MLIARKQVLVQFTDALLESLDKRVAQVGGSRSALIRDAIERYLDREAEIDRQIVEGYRRIPETEEELRWAEASSIEMLEEESW